MSSATIQVEGLSKRYRIGVRLKHRSFREALTDAALAPVRRLRSFGRSSHREEDSIWALKDVSFEVGRGEVLGIIGRNGAGKTTLLKVLSRITEPTEGRAVLNGRVGSLLEVGTGFHHELTGRENVYLSAAILGMRKAETDARFDEIVDFSGIEQFIDTPVKRYSSGMLVRLGFAVAAHLEPEILLIDEVLAVGDVAFRRKCLGKMDEVTRAGRTVLFVSHNMASIVDMCPRAIWLESGSVALEGPSAEVVQAYLRAGANMALGGDRSAQRTDAAALILNVECLGEDGKPRSMFLTGGQAMVRIAYEVRRPLRLGLGISINDSSGRRIFASYAPHEGITVERTPGRYTAEFFVPRILMNSGTYFVTASLRQEPTQQLLDELAPAASFDTVAADVAGGGTVFGPNDGVFWLDHEWRI